MEWGQNQENTDLHKPYLSYSYLPFVHSFTETCTRKHTYMLGHTQAHTHRNTHTLTHTETHTLTHKETHTLTHTYTFTHRNTHTHTCTHRHTHTITHRDTILTLLGCHRDHSSVSKLCHPKGLGQPLLSLLYGFGAVVLAFRMLRMHP